MAAVKESSDKARLVGINHVALEVGNIEEALAFYGRLFEFSLRGRSAKIAFIDLGGSRKPVSALCPDEGWSSGTRGETACKSWSTRISSSPSIGRCLMAWVARTFTNRPQRSRNSPVKESHSKTPKLRVRANLRRALSPAAS